jgi:hypothetical protein
MKAIFTMDELWNHFIEMESVNELSPSEDEDYWNSFFDDKLIRPTITYDKITQKSFKELGI